VARFPSREYNPGEFFTHPKGTHILLELGGEVANFDPRWRKFLQNLGWYVLAVAFAIVLVFFFRLRTWVWLPWLIALGGGLWLIWQQLKRNGGKASDSTRAGVYLEQALAYKRQIDQAIRTASRSSQAIHLQQLAAQIDAWTEAIQDLVQRIANLQQDKLIRRDIKSVPEAIADLEARLKHEPDAAIRAQLQRTLVNRRKQLASLEQLQNTIRRAEIQIESTLSLLGTIYSQILTGQSTSHVADYSRFSAEVDEEVRMLQDQLEALREVKLGNER
jgi:tetratricopeptide (TPR) repeat protein